ncbi:iron ABC transporter permease [Terribacillus sp. 7520-G]|uniref:FecCD family ABC transporter permease n=1 Tax=Terribacillus sp. 7520-G TaxID=2025389 RepID=UPI000BA6D972|nr:ferrichrome ABC transporter permease [Terribacillus sp. 7520-G]
MYPGTKNRIALLVLLTAPLTGTLVMLISVLYGVKDMPVTTIWDAIFHYDAQNVDHAILLTARLPRALAALLVGAFLAIAGAIMQGITRNYLASPSIMGVNDGSALVITMCMVLVPGLSDHMMILYSMAGSALGAGIVFGFASLLKNGMAPVQLAIIGTVIGTFLSGLAAAFASYYQVSQHVSIWYNARMDGVDVHMLKLAVPIGLVGLVLAMSVSKSVTVMALGEEVAAGLGQKTVYIRLISMLSVVCLTGTAVALVGKIAFVGLVVPHITRFLIGVDYRLLIPCSAVIGGIFLCLSDVVSRFINAPFETPIGVVTAFIGVPFFLCLIWRKGGKQYAA